MLKKTQCARRDVRSREFQGKECTFHELSILFGELFLPVGSEKAVVSQTMRVRQTLHYCIQETLGWRQ